MEKNSGQKCGVRVLKWAIPIILIMAIAIAWISNATRSPSNPYPRTICESFSADKQYKIRIREITPAIFFGPQQVGIEFFSVAKNSPELTYLIATLQTEVSNDGKALKGDNFQITWREHSAIIIVSGEEQQDEVFRASFYEDGAYTIERE